MSCKHIALKSAASKRQFSGSPSYTNLQRLILKGRGSEKWPYNESPELQSNFHKFCVVMVVSDSLTGTLIWWKFSWGAYPWIPLQHCVLYVQKKFACCMATPTPTLCVPPPFFNLWIHLWYYPSNYLWLSGSSLCFTMHKCNADSKLVWTQGIGVNMQR